MGKGSNVSANVFRPKKWDDVIGQSAIVATLRNEVIRKTIHNAYLFCGQRGVGKTTIARILATAINCKCAQGNDGNPCGECIYCKSDYVFELDAASNNSVEDIRNIIEQVRFPSGFVENNVFIIDEVHMLSQAAFNAFLKTLEEPPQNTIFIMATTEGHKVPATILSRCQCFNFKQISTGDIVRQLSSVLKSKNINFENEALSVIAEKADGAMRDALSMLDGIIAFCGTEITLADVMLVLNILDEETYFKLSEILLRKDISGAVIFLNDILQKGFSLQSFLDGLMNHFMNLFLATDERTIDLLSCSDIKKNEYKKQSSKFDSESLQEIVKYLNTDSINYRMSVNKKFFLEMILMNIIEKIL